MNILLLYVDVAGRSIDDPIISGGTELFSRLVRRNFDSIEVFQVPWKSDKNQNKILVSQIRNIVENKRIDLILSSNMKSVCLYSIRNLGVPILHITHTNYGVINSNDILNCMTDIGHSMYGVSQANINWMTKKSVRMKIPHVNYSGIINPSYCMYDLEVNTSPTNNVVTVGRANNYKAPFYLYNKLKTSKYNPLVITAKGVDENSVEYYEKNKDKPHLLDVDHTTVMNYLKDSAATCITCSSETFGIVALESLSVGTPILIRASDGTSYSSHSSEEIGADSSHYRSFYSNTDLEPIIDDIIKVDRKEIKEMTQEKHSKEKWVSCLSAAFDRTAEKFKKNNKKDYNPMSDFF